MGKITHGLAGSLVLNSWSKMMARCYNAECDQYKNYGGRGIEVDDKWHDARVFYLDVGNRPHGKTLDRPDVNGDYGPDNWKWSTPTEQNRNMRSNRRLRLNQMSLTVSEWSEMLGISSSLIRARIDKLGWSVRDALTRPVQIQ